MKDLRIDLTNPPAGPLFLRDYESPKWVMDALKTSYDRLFIKTCLGEHNLYVENDAEFLMMAFEDAMELNRESLWEYSLPLNSCYEMLKASGLGDGVKFRVESPSVHGTIATEIVLSIDDYFKGWEFLAASLINRAHDSASSSPV